MPFMERRANIVRLVRGASATLFVVASAANAQVPPPNPQGPKANWTLFNQFGTPSMRNLTFSTNITPRWIGETDSLFYNWRDHSGEHWYLVNALLKTKKPLFDHSRLAAQLSVLKQKAVEAYALNEQFTLMNITKDHKNLRFAVDSTRYNWNLATEVLTSMGRYRGAQDSLMVKDEEVDLTLGNGGGRGGGGGGRGAAPPVAGGRGATPPDIRNWSPDSTAFVFAKNYNLFFVEKGKNDTLQITHEGIDKFSFAGGGRGGFGGQQDTTDGVQQQETQNTAAAATRPSRAAVTWAPDSKAFYITRTDTRGVKDLYLVRSITEPRPTLMQYQYPMPGEDSI
ncbi:MAG: DPP IV N-terminal domain-containing protein, partial [Gemmatimonadaceae bacterium]